MSRSVLVTGGAGFIGSHLVERLLADGHRVTVIDNFSTGRPINLAHLRDHPQLTVHEADIADLARIAPWFEGVDWVFHLAALADIVPSIQQPLAYHHSNVDGTVSVLEASRAAGVTRFVYTASSSCFGIPDEYPTPETADIRPQYPYALTKYVGEQYALHWARVYKLPVVSLRLFNVYGPRSRTSGTYGAVFGVFLAQHLHGQPLTIVGDGTQTRDFTFVTDVVDAFVTAARSDVSGEVFNVGSTNTYSVNQLATLIGGDVVHIQKRPGEPDCTFADTSKIHRMLGWKPRVAFEDGVRIMLDHLDDWRDAPVWNPASIADATKEWFQYLSPPESASTDVTDVTEPAPIRTPGPRRKIVLEALIVLAIAVAGAAVGGMYRRVHVATGQYADFPQQELGAAVALTCGYGYHDLSLDIPPVAAFLSRKVDIFRCADLAGKVPPKAPSFSQGLYRYLFGAIALTWTLVGEISWKGLTPLFAVAYALTLVSAYAIFRAGMGRVAAALATIPLLVSAVHLDRLPDFRDYAKAPFILGLLAIMAWLPRAGLDRRRILAAAAVFGVVLGVGFGFRNDLLIVVVPWALIVLFGVPGPIWANLRLKGLALAVSAAAFLITAAPILSAYSRGSNSGHVTLLGLMSQPFDSHLGLSRSVYDWGHYYADGFANRVITRYDERAHGVTPPYLSADYDRAAAEYVALIAKQFPADVVARAYGSVLKVVDVLPFHEGAFGDAVPPAIAAPRLKEFYEAQRTVLSLLDGTGVVITAVALLIISSRGLRAAVLVLLCLVYFAGYPAIQFTGRHLFHLEFIAWGALAVVLEALAIRLFRRRVPTGEGVAGPSARTIGLRVAAFTLIAVVVLPGSLSALRAYQAPHVRARLEADYLRAPREPVAIEPQTGANGRVLLTMPGLWTPDASKSWLASAYLVVELSSRGCDATRVPLSFRYESPYPDGDFSRDYVVDLDERGEPTVILFPVFYDPQWVQFKGIRVGALDRSCVMSVSRIKQEHEPRVLLWAVLPPDWRESSLYSTFTSFEQNDEERRHAGRLTQVTKPLTLPLPRRFDLQRFAAPNPATEFYAPIVTRRDGGALAMKGFTVQHAVLIPEQKLAQGTIAVARGEVREGGLSLGVSDRDGRLTSVTVESPGPFVIAVEVPASESYSVVLDTFVVGSRRWTVRVAEWLLRKFPQLVMKVDVDVEALGWLPPLETAGGPR